MHQRTGINFLMIVLLLLIVLFSESMAQPPLIPQQPKIDPPKGPLIELPKPNLKGSIPTFEVPEVRHTVTGKLIRTVAIGGETTGWAVDLDEPRQIGGKRLTRIEIDPAGEKVGDFENRRVVIAGTLEKRSGVERGEYWVIVVKEIRGYSN